MTYDAQEHLRPRGLTGISEGQIEQRWHLCEAYVKSTNESLAELAAAECGSRGWGELNRRLGLEFDGMVLHDYYFGSLAAGSTRSPGSELATALVSARGDVPAWREDFARTAAMRGIGWVILYRDPLTARLFSWWVSDHEVMDSATRMAKARG